MNNIIVWGYSPSGIDCVTWGFSRAAVEADHAQSLREFRDQGYDFDPLSPVEAMPLAQIRNHDWPVTYRIARW